MWPGELHCSAHCFEAEPWKEGMDVSSCRRGAKAGAVHEALVKELNVSSRIHLDLQQDHYHHLPLHCHKHNLGILRVFLEKVLNITWEQKNCVLVRFVCPEFSCVIPSQVLSSSIIRKYGLGKRNCEFLQWSLNRRDIADLHEIILWLQLIYRIFFL